jgi:hypothetical protein
VGDGGGSDTGRAALGMGVTDFNPEMYGAPTPTLYCPRLLACHCVSAVAAQCQCCCHDAGRLPGQATDCGNARAPPRDLSQAGVPTHAR